MSDDLREAAETVPSVESTGQAWAAEPGRLIPAAVKLARDYLAEHPEPFNMDVVRAMLASPDLIESGYKAATFLRDRMAILPADIRAEAESVLGSLVSAVNKAMG